MLCVAVLYHAQQKFSALQQRRGAVSGFGKCHGAGRGGAGRGDVSACHKNLVVLRGGYSIRSHGFHGGVFVVENITVCVVNRCHKSHDSLGGGAVWAKRPAVPRTSGKEPHREEP